MQGIYTFGIIIGKRIIGFIMVRFNTVNAYVRNVRVYEQPLSDARISEEGYPTWED